MVHLRPGSRPAMGNLVALDCYALMTRRRLGRRLCGLRNPRAADERFVKCDCDAACASLGAVACEANDVGRVSASTKWTAQRASRGRQHGGRAAVGVAAIGGVR